MIAFFLPQGYHYRIKGELSFFTKVATIMFFLQD